MMNKVCPECGKLGVWSELDLWVSADGGEVLRLDEDEFAAGGLTETDPGAAAEARQALDELESLAHRTGLAPLLS